MTDERPKLTVIPSSSQSARSMDLMDELREKNAPQQPPKKDTTPAINLNRRIGYVNAALFTVEHAMQADQATSHDAVADRHYLEAVQQLKDLQTGLKALQIRINAIGR